MGKGGGGGVERYEVMDTHFFFFEFLKSGPLKCQKRVNSGPETVFGGVWVGWYGQKHYESRGWGFSKNDVCH